MTMTTVRIPLGDGRFATIDADDAPMAIAYRWYYRSKLSPQQATRGDVVYGKADPQQGDRGFTQGCVLLHDVICPGEDGQIIHVNRDPLDCRKANLTRVYHGQCATGAGSRGGTSQYKGVCWEPRKQVWRSYIVVHGKQTHLGYYLTEDDAARAYDRAAVQAWGDAARTNFAGEGR